MKELIRQLTIPSGPSGYETPVKEVIHTLVQPHADEVYDDALGNLYAVKQGASGAAARTILLAAHMDEPALSVIDIDDQGFLRAAPLGPLRAWALVGARVVFARTGRRGIVGAEHGVAQKDLDFSRLFVDIGAASADDAREHVRIGDAATFAYGFDEVGADLVVGHALDNRVGCAVLVEALRRVNSDCTVVAVFSAQQEVGSRGARVAGHRIDPDMALALDVSPVGDTPKSERLALTLGGGPGVKALDATMVVAPKVRDMIVDAARLADVPYQIEVSPGTASDAGALFLSRAGIPTGGIVVPARYVGTPSQMVHLRDVEHTVTLLTAFLARLR
ncbi:MAG: M42 family metallopeptidase [Bacilli bacterium]